MKATINGMNTNIINGTPTHAILITRINLQKVILPISKPTKYIAVAIKANIFTIFFMSQNLAS